MKFACFFVYVARRRGDAEGFGLYNESTMNDCIICKLVRNELPSRVVYEDENFVCFLPLEVEAFGHTIIAPKPHYADLFSVSAECLNDLFAVIQKVALHYQTALGATGINLLHACGVSAQQSVPHLHFHLIPRFDEDGLDAWPMFPKTQQDKDELLKMLRL